MALIAAAVTNSKTGNSLFAQGFYKVQKRDLSGHDTFQRSCNRIAEAIEKNHVQERLIASLSYGKPSDSAVVFHAIQHGIYMLIWNWVPAIIFFFLISP